MSHSLLFSKGFTLIELMITIAIAGIIATMAIPSFNDTIRSNRLTTQANELITAFNFARSEAIKRGHPVVVRKTGTNWENGWQVFVDIKRDGSFANTYNSSDDILLRVYQALPDNYTLRGNNNFVNFIRYEPNGISNNMGSFALCDNRDGSNIPRPNASRLIIVNAVGRVRIGTDTNDDGIPEKDGNIDIVSCTVSPF
ncbi:GspH/FimT family protein [Methylicorpusculum oleiharenae]|uniref:GspH/FimT family pseudopilin n=1 Tax=Methylicorpusculum oleiharenae TaxID=1338687 RepID=UPI00135CDF61|nr:GspH/FimT family protein [Methylicorpusculum oleiharenae]MCD2449271.1 GspH/FimT family protein [Methylicorpusculum oleiharenae]